MGIQEAIRWHLHPRANPLWQSRTIRPGVTAVRAQGDELTGKLYYLPRLIFIFYYLYPRPTLLVLASVLASLGSMLFRFPIISVLSLALALLSLSEAYRHRTISRYLAAPTISPGPKVIVNLQTPFVKAEAFSLFRSADTFDLGDLPINVPFQIRAILHNIGRADCTDLHVDLDLPNKALGLVDGSQGVEIGKLASGRIAVLDWTLVPFEGNEGPLGISIRARWSGGESKKSLEVRSCFDSTTNYVTEAHIERWRHGYLAAVAWRGDIDGFANLSNEKTLSPAFECARIFRVAPSLFISGRLVLDYREWESWLNHFPDKLPKRPSQHVFDNFLEFLSKIEAKNDLEYPLEGCSWPCAQVGNHMYYHYYSRYGYDASEDTGWTNFVAPGTFNHSWEVTDPSRKTVLSEIQENMAICNEMIKKFFGAKPTTWAAPADMPHPLYPKALENVGLVGASEAVPGRSTLLSPMIAPYRPDLGQMLPYHPAGSRIVETGAHIRRFDPHTVNQVVSLKKAVLMAIRRHSQVTFLIHPFLRLYSPHFGPQSCLQHFSEILRFLVEDLGSAAWITTHHGIVSYWERVLCPKHRVVSCRVENGVAFIENNSKEDLSRIPLELRFRDGKTACILVDLPAESKVAVPSVHKSPESSVPGIDAE